MKTDKTQLIQDIEAIKKKLATMEEELNKTEDVFKHFPSIGDKYYYYVSSGTICNNNSSSDDLKVNAYKTWEEANKAYKKAAAIEKVKRRLLELQGDWKPNWEDDNEEKFHIVYEHNRRGFISFFYITIQQCILLPYMKNNQIVELIINEMEDELKLIFDIA